MTSMTGHGRGEAKTKTWTATVECYSVNRKSAEVVFHSERGAAWLEPFVRESVLACIARGRVQVNLLLNHTSGQSGLFFDEQRAAAFVSEARRLQKKLGVSGEITISDVLAVAGLETSTKPEGEAPREVVLAALEKALTGLVATRNREGATLQKVLGKSVNHLAAITKKIGPLADGVTAQYRQTLWKRIERADLGLIAEDPRLIAEVALFAERCDITEELERAASHIAQFHEKLASTAPMGRTLEFLAQELGREFNTIGSKSADTRIARLVIDAKTELDRIREQLANIE